MLADTVVGKMEDQEALGVMEGMVAVAALAAMEERLVSTFPTTTATSLWH